MKQSKVFFSSRYFPKARLVPMKKKGIFVLPYNMLLVTFLAIVTWEIPSWQDHISPGISVIEGICHRPFHPHRLFSGMLLLVFPILQGRTCYRVYRKSDAQSSSSPQVKEMTRESSVGLLQLILFCYFICYPLCQENTGKGDGSLHLLCFWTHVPSLPNHCYFLCHSLCVCVLQY